MCNKNRIKYSKDFKRQALINYKNPKEFEKMLLKYGYDIEKLCANDKKYCAKLLHKWKKEACRNNEILYFINTELTNSAIEDELDNLSDEHDGDLIMEETKRKILEGVKKYKSLKNRIKSAGFKKGQNIKNKKLV